MKVQNILRCYAAGMSIKGISHAFELSRNTVRHYVRKFHESNIPIEELLKMSEHHLQEMFASNNERERTPSRKRQELDALLPDYEARLSRKGVTLQSFNSKKMAGRPESRKELFEQIEKDYLRDLPAVRYQLRERKSITVMRNSYITLNKHHYSVPTDYIGKRVDVVYDAETIEVYHGLQLITTHHRDDTPYAYTRKEAHNLPGIRGSYEQDLEDVYIRAGQVDNIVLNYLKEVASQLKYPPKAFRSCRGILSLAQKYGEDRLVAACAYATEARRYGYQEVSDILQNGDDATYLEQDDVLTDNTPTPVKHKNIRGKEYFRISSKLSNNNNQPTKH